jgi:hypothetical protein
MLPTEDLFVYVYVLIDDAISSRAIAIAPGRARHRACSRYGGQRGVNRLAHTAMAPRGHGAPAAELPG